MAVRNRNENQDEQTEVQIFDPKEFTERLERFDKLFFLIIGAMLIGFLSLLFMVVGLVIDSWRFNSTIYKESKQLTMQEKLFESNVEQQKIIIQSLEEIKQVLKSK